MGIPGLEPSGQRGRASKRCRAPHSGGSTDKTHRVSLSCVPLDPHVPRRAELFNTALAIDGPESAERLGLIHELRRRDDEETFAVLAQRATDGDEASQALALEVLGQFGFERGRPWLEQSLPIVTAATNAIEPAVLVAAVNALGHLGDRGSWPSCGATYGWRGARGSPRRKDLSILPCLVVLLDNPNVGEVEAAAELADSRLLPALKRLKRSGWSERDRRGTILDTAIEACAY